MKNITLLTLVILLFGSLSISFAQDKTDVQTFTFEDITKRRGTYNFPDNDDTYRKILMYKTLKCDPRTTHDNYNCGEWDYLTHTRVHVHTGQIDSTLETHPLYKVGLSAPDTINYTDEPTFTTYQKYHYNISVDNIISEEEYELGNGTYSFDLPKGTNRIQFFIPRDTIAELGKSTIDINRLKLYVDKVGGELKNLTIRLMKFSGSDEIEEFLQGDLTTVFQGDVTLTEGWNYFYLENPFSAIKFMNLAVELSYTTGDDYEVNILRASTGFRGLIANLSDKFLQFDGVNDYIECGVLEEMKGARKFTWEANVRIDSWAAWKSIFRIAGRVLLQTGPAAGQLYCIVRNPDNTHGNAKNAINLSEWNHLAMVFDGTKENNVDRLKLFVNGKPVSLTFSGNIPDRIEELLAPFELSYGVNSGFDNVRIWTGALDEQTINDWMYKQPDQEHPNFNDLLIYYPFDENSGLELFDQSGNEHKGRFIGVPEWVDYPGTEISATITANVKQTASVPNLILLSGEYEITKDSTLIIETKQNANISVATYEIVNYTPIIKDIAYHWASGYTYTINPNGNRIDSTYNAPQEQLINSEIEYFGKPFEVIDNIEIGRFITPYGIGLDLGPEGFTWVYDVTDYAHLLKGEVDLSTGNQQELTDLRFEFYIGTPPRDVLRIDRPWGALKSVSYKALSEDTQLSETTIDLLPEAKQFKMKTRLTGHGHNSNDGNYPHCCEWKNNTHSLLAGGEKVADWHIWQPVECADNPVFPQGGTWPGAREGWCPGDVVRDFEFDLTDYVVDNQLNIDYDITKVPFNNQGMGNGNYRVSMHLVEYSDENFDLDAEIYEILSPNDFRYFSRKNPTCSYPKIEVRNNGKDPLTMLDFEYGVSGGEKQDFSWSASEPIKPHQKQTIMLPIPNSEFWIGDSKHEFTVTLSSPNGQEDMYQDNNTMSTTFEIPDFYDNTDIPEIWLKPSDRENDYTLIIRDYNGDEVFRQNYFDKNQIYKIPLNYYFGCYTLEFRDVGNQVGLSYWVYRNYYNQGLYPAYQPGWMRIVDGDGNIIKAFESEFGYAINYSFLLEGISLVQDEGHENLINLYPNPVIGNINISSDYSIGEAEIQIIDLKGNIVLSLHDNIYEGFQKIINAEMLSAGFYTLRITNGKFDIKKSFLKK